MSVRRIAIALTAVAMLSACSSSPAGTTLPAATPTTGATASPLIPIPTATLPTATTPGVTPGPTIAGDPVLAAMFPTQLGGQPVVVNTGLLLDFMKAFGATEADIDPIRQVLTPIGITLDTITFGIATVKVNESQISWQALRLGSGEDPNLLVQYYQLLELAPSNTGDTVKQESIGGKTVSVVRAADGSAVLWMYVNGQVFWSLATDDETIAALVFAALP
jgi:hypothetical protein